MIFDDNNTQIFYDNIPISMSCIAQNYFYKPLLIWINSVDFQDIILEMVSGAYYTCSIN